MSKIKTILFISALFVLSTVLVGCGKGKTFTVTFDSNGGTKVAEQKVKENEKVEKPEEPTKEGYNFKGWYLDGKKYSFNKKVTKNIKLKAKWSKIVEDDEEIEVIDNYVPVVNNNQKPPKPAPVVVKKDALMTTEFPEKIYALEETEFSITTTANDDKNLMVVGTYSISNIDYVSSFQYFENDAWTDLDANAFGPTTGFPLGDATNKFKIEFTNDEIYTLTFKLLNVKTGDIVCEVQKVITVEKRPAELQTEFPEKIYPLEETEFNISTIANGYKDVMVVGNGIFSSIEAISELKYFNESTEEWINVELESDFGPAIGFPLGDTTNKFKITFNSVGTYEITFQLLDVETRNVVAEVTNTITVEEKPAELQTEFEENIYALEETEFNIITTANKDENLDVIGLFTISDIDAVSSFQYFDETDETWYEFNTDLQFGPTTGFPLIDATNKFKITFDSVGTYEITYQLLNLETGDVVAEVTNTITVEEKPAELQTEFEENIYALEETEFNIITTANKDENLDVIGLFTISDIDAVSSFQYFDETDETWYEFDTDLQFGPATGFSLVDATNKFKITFDSVGTYEITYQLLNPEMEDVVAEVTNTITVEEKSTENSGEAIPA